MAEDARNFTADSFYAYLKEEKRLMGVRCRHCEEISVEPRAMCPACHSKDVEWYEFSGKGQLNAFTCISIVPVYLGQQGYGRNNPYCTGIVTLAEGPRIAAMIHGVDTHNPQNIKTGTEVLLDVEDLDPEKPALAFRPA